MIYSTTNRFHSASSNTLNSNKNRSAVVYISSAKQNSGTHRKKQYEISSLASNSSSFVLSSKNFDRKTQFNNIKNIVVQDCKNQINVLNLKLEVYNINSYIS
jgi:hypothetical protein